MSLLQMSISAGIMILIVIIIRMFTINRLPKKTFLALWGIILARLLLPFSWPSPLSVYSFISNPMKQVGNIPITDILPNVFCDYLYKISRQVYKFICSRKRFYYKMDK